MVCLRTFLRTSFLTIIHFCKQLVKPTRFINSKSIQQNRIITGSVIDESGEALIGVSVLVKGTTLGTVTDLDGNFTLEVPTGAILVVSYVGYKTQEIKVGEQQKLAITVSYVRLSIDRCTATYV